MYLVKDRLGGRGLREAQISASLKKDEMKQMDACKTKLPQLRILATDFCDSKCIYCRPGGEGNLDCKGLLMSNETALAAASAYRRIGGNSIKITGGDPAFWPFLAQYVAFLKQELQYEHVEVITRSVKIAPILNELKLAGLDVINFSLDTVEQNRYRIITQKNDFEQLKEIIICAAQQIYCKINSVILPDTLESEIENMLAFCRMNHIRELKLLDYIDDLQGGHEKNSFDQFDLIYRLLARYTDTFSIQLQGGLGHPMRAYQLSEQLKVLCKDARVGAWYCELCRKCEHYPCHDALMALRVTPSDSFQLCLLNRKLHWKFNQDNMEKQLASIMKYFETAFFRE